MDLSKTKPLIKFRTGGRTLKEIGISEEMQGMILRRVEELFPGNESIIFTLEKVFTNSLRWIMKTRRIGSEGGKGVIRHYVKMIYGTGNCFNEIVGQRRAMEMASRVHILHEANELLIESPPRNAIDNLGKEGAVVPPCKWVIMEIQLLLEKSKTLDMFLRQAVFAEYHPNGRNRLRLRKCLRKIAEDLAEILEHKVHIIKPSKEDVNLNETESDKLFVSTVKSEYRRAISDILERMKAYLPLGVSHPYIKECEKERLWAVGQKLVGKWFDKTPCYGAVHGDLNSTNILIQPKDASITLIDFSPRVHWGDPAWDSGRLVGDLLGRYYELGGSPLIREFIDTFIDASERLTGDKEYYERLCLGIFSMTLLKLYPKGRPIQNQYVAQAYLRNSLRILEQGCFSWP